ncbi:acid protease [Thozetella sp. PMI_491]|nr:acid protease [Thozetella sp. PMI_491]
MKTSTALQLLLAVSGASAASIPKRDGAVKAVRRDPFAVTDNVLRLRKTTSPGQISKRATSSSEKGQAVLSANPSYPVVDVEFDGETIPMLVDTGSSDIWIVKKGFKCVSKKDQPVDAENCNIPQTVTQKPSGGYVKNANLSITYGDQSFVSGPMAFQDVTVAGLTVKKQQVGVADVVSVGAGGGDSSYSGLMGVSYPALTSEVDTETGESVQYTSIMANMQKQNVASSFSMALDRGLDRGGFMAFGGVPPVDILGDYVTTPILKPTVKSDDGSTSQGDFNGYYVNARMVLRHSSDGSIPTVYNVTNEFKYSDKFKTLIDSGTSLTTVHKNLASHIMTAFNPPAQLNVNPDDDDSYYVLCTAQAPFLGVWFGNDASTGVVWFDSQDLILQDSWANVNGKKYCLTGVQAASDDDDPIMGDTFMHNALVVFNVGDSNLSFAQRPMYN